MSDRVQLVPILIVAAVLLLFVVVGLLSRARAANEYGLGGRSIGRIGGGAAVASNWMSAASIMGLAGVLYLSGYYAFAYVIGWTGGYVLLLLLLAGQLRRFGKFTAPDFVADRYDSDAARLLAACISIGIAIIYCVAQFRGIGLIFSWLFGIDYLNGLLLGGTAVVAYLVISGMLGVTRSQKLQYFVLIISFILPLMWLARKFGYFWILPQFGYGEALPEVERVFGTEFTAPFAAASPYQWVALCFTLMVGTAGLPHVLSRFYLVPNIRDARWSLVWGLFFIALIYWSAPAYAVFARLMEARSGVFVPPGAARGMADLVIFRAVTVGSLPIWLTGVLAAGATCAAFFTVAGLLINGAASLSHDIYFRVVNPSASESQKMIVAKFAVPMLAGVVMMMASNPPGLIAEITAVAFALAGNTIFPVFLLGIWWWRTNRAGVVAGMVTGLVITFASPLFGGMLPLLHTLVPMTSSALIGVPIVITVIIIVSLLTEPPSTEIRRFLAEQVHGHLD
jgi:cation/acetate symporter